MVGTGSSKIFPRKHQNQKGLTNYTHTTRVAQQRKTVFVEFGFTLRGHKHIHTSMYVNFFYYFSFIPSRSVSHAKPARIIDVRVEPRQVKSSTDLWLVVVQFDSSTKYCHTLSE